LDPFKADFTWFVERVGLVIDGAGVIVIAVGLIVALLRYVLERGRTADPFRQLRQNLGRGILLGLEFLVAADIIRTVAVTPTLQSVLVLGMIVLIRTFLSMALQVEVEGRLPWQRPPSAS
jgi:uncharacterized membrane protein